MLRNQINRHNLYLKISITNILGRLFANIHDCSTIFSIRYHEDHKNLQHDEENDAEDCEEEL